MVKETFARTKPTLSLESPPSISGYSVTIVSTITTFSSATLEIFGSGAGSWYFLIYATPSMSQGVMTPPSSWFRLIRASGVVFSPTTFDFTSVYSQKFGPQATGSLTYFKLLLVNTLSGERISAGLNKVTVT